VGLAGSPKRLPLNETLNTMAEESLAGEFSPFFLCCQVLEPKPEQGDLLAMQPPTPFQDARDFFYRHAVPQFQQSPEYAGLFTALDPLLRLGDRLLLACQGEPEQQGIRKVGQRLAHATETVEDLLGVLEIWLKAVLWLANPERHRQALTVGRGYNLFRVLLDLDLLTRQELELSVEKAQQIPDPVRRDLLYAKEDRNPLIHDTHEPANNQRERLPRVAAVALLAPLLRHADALQQALTRLLTRPPWLQRPSDPLPAVPRANGRPT